MPSAFAEMVRSQQEAAPQVAARIKGYVELRGELGPLIETLRRDHQTLAADSEAAAALEELATLEKLLACTQLKAHISFDMSLARGLDYYTGLIYEVVLEGAQVGSIAAGGRWAQLLVQSSQNTSFRKDAELHFGSCPMHC